MHAAASPRLTPDSRTPESSRDLQRRMVPDIKAEPDLAPGEPANTSSLNSSEGNGNKVVLRLGDISSLELSELPLQRSYKGCQAKWQHGYNKTWNENMKGKYRQSIQTADIFQPGYDPVFGNVRDRRPERDMSRQTPRSRKKSKQQAHGVYRSKSCEKVAGVIDKLSGKLSLNSPGPPSCPPTPAPPTPTPSLLHSVAARAIPCVDIKVTSSVSPQSRSQSKFHPPQPPRGVSSNARLSPTPTESSIYGSGTGSTFEGYKVTIICLIIVHLSLKANRVVCCTLKVADDR